MKSKYTWLIYLYGLVGLTYISACHLESTPVAWLTKPMLLIILAIWFLLQTQNNSSRFRWLIVAGLVFSFGGDTLLMFVESHGEHFFLLGLGSFLITHLLYLTAFKNVRSSEKGFAKKNPKYVFLLLVFFAMFSWYLIPDVPSAMQLPVLVYSGVIVGMVIMALNLGGKIGQTAFQLIFVGALLFMLSDMLIALNKFKSPIPFSYVWIMSLYLLGQLGITRGSVEVNDNL